MPIPLTTLFANLSSIFHSRAALQLENLALRRQIGVASAILEKTTKMDSVGPLIIGLALLCLERLALGAGHRRAQNGLGLASQGFSSFLDLESAARPTGTTCQFP